MADVNGAVQNGETFDPLQENATGAAQDTVTPNPLSEPGDGTEVLNTTTAAAAAAAEHGHINDANTFALWRFNETAHADLSATADETGNYNASQTTDANKPGIMGGPAGVGDYARWFIGPAGSRALDFTPDGTMTTTLIGEWTLEAWVYLEDMSAETTIINVGGSGEAAADNYLIWWTIHADGNMEAFWETGSGTDIGVVQNAGTTVPLRTWTYVAITGSVAATTRTINFFVDSGTSQDSGTGTTATGGTVVEGVIGEERDSTEEFWGGISQLRLSSVIRTGTELNNNSNDASFTFANDADTEALWQFQEPPEVVDISGNGYHLQQVLSSTTRPRISESLIKDDGKSRVVQNTNEFYVLYQQEAVRLLLQGEYTLEWWGQFQANALDRGILRWGGSGETPGANFQIVMDFDVLAGNYRLHVLWKEGSGVNVEATGSNTIVFDNGEEETYGGGVHHFAVVFQDAGGGQRNVLIYRDATLIETLGPLNLPDGGTSTVTSSNGLEVLRAESALWEGLVDDMRLSDKARSAAEIQVSYNRGIAAGSGTGVATIVRQNPELTRTNP